MQKLMRFLSGLLLMSSAVIHAQTGFPVKPIRVIVPVAPGGSVDTVTRVVAQRMSENVGQSVVLENRAGASTNIGNELVARAPGDGYTLLANTVPFVANVSLYSKLGYDPEKDFAPVSLLVSAPSLVVVHPSVPARNMREFVALAKKAPSTIKYSTSGAGGITHLSLELLAYQTAIKLVHVPYKGGGPALIALMSGEVDVSFLPTVAVGSHASSGRLRLLAVTSAQRLASMPAMPTVTESGVPGYVFSSWVGVLAPASTPAPIVKILNDHFVRAARSPDIVERFAREGAEVVASSPEQFRRVIAEEVPQWAKVIKQAGIRAE